MFRSRALSLVMAALVVPGFVWAQDFFIYPRDGQSPEQQQRDENECMNWARDQTGFDPLATPRATRPPPQQTAGSTAGGAGRGALGGAAAGAAIGALTGDTRRGAGIGAASGALIGGSRRSNQRRNEQAARDNWEREQAAIHAEGRNNFNRAFRGCLEGRGYTVS